MRKYGKELILSLHRILCARAGRKGFIIGPGAHDASRYHPGELYQSSTRVRYKSVCARQNQSQHTDGWLLESTDWQESDAAVPRSHKFTAQIAQGRRRIAMFLVPEQGFACAKRPDDGPFFHHFFQMSR